MSQTDLRTLCEHLSKRKCMYTFLNFAKQWGSKLSMKSNNHEYFSCRYFYKSIQRILNYQIKGLYQNGLRSMNCTVLQLI